MHHSNSGSVQNLDNFGQTLNSSICAMDYETMRGDNLVSAQFDGVELGEVSIYRYQGRPLHVCSRKSEHILADRADDFLFAMPRKIACEVNRAHHNVVLQEPCSLLLLSTLEPFEILYGVDAKGIQVGDIVRIPGRILRKHIPHLDDCCGIPIASREGASTIMYAAVESLYQAGGSLSAAQARMFGSMLANAAGIAMLNAPELHNPMRSRRDAAHAKTRINAQSFIECNLSNPELDAAMVARKCHVSMRNLYAAFESMSVTVGALIRELRLQRCREDLTDPGLRNQFVSMIAMKWGYCNIPSFTRSYKERFGISPGEERRKALIERGH